MYTNCKVLKKKWKSIPLELINAPIWITLFLIASEEQLKRGNPLSVFFSVISLAGMFFSLALLLHFVCYKIPCYNKTFKNEAKYSFTSFTFFFIIVIIVLIGIFYTRNSGRIPEIPEITKHIKDLEQYSSFIMDDKLNLTIFLDLMFAFVFWYFYFIYCVTRIFQLTRIFPILFVFYEKFLRSRIVAIVAWLLIATNIGPMTIDSSSVFKFFYIIFGSLAVLAYPFFDMFEFTYQQIGEYENAQDIRKN